VLKASRSSIWLLNMQLACATCFFSALVCLAQDSQQLLSPEGEGFFGGYNHMVCAVVVLQAATGLAVALVVKHADNIHKGFCASASIVIANSLDSALFHDTYVNETFILGAAIVLLSCVAFAVLVSHSSSSPAASLINNPLPPPSLLSNLLGKAADDFGELAISIDDVVLRRKPPKLPI
jgi:UDP-sugar transporter A1/2/3